MTLLVFPVAREHLLSNPHDWVVTNIRLAAHNGLHLMHLAAAARLPARFVVYADRQDLLLAREAQRAGAFYEARHQVHRAFAAYLRATLPPHDRRGAQKRDRRRFMFRGGCRCTDGGWGLTPPSKQDFTDAAAQVLEVVQTLVFGEN
jgi:hypothetical protein